MKSRAFVSVAGIYPPSWRNGMTRRIQHSDFQIKRKKTEREMFIAFGGFAHSVPLDFRSEPVRNTNEFFSV